MNSFPHLLTRESEIISKKDELGISFSCGNVSLSLFLLQNKKYPSKGMTTGPQYLASLTALRRIVVARVNGFHAEYTL